MRSETVNKMLRAHLTAIVGEKEAANFSAHEGFRGGGLVAMIHGDFSIGAQEYLGRWARGSRSRPGYARWARSVMKGVAPKMFSTRVESVQFMG